MSAAGLLLAFALTAGGEPAPVEASACVRVRELPVGEASIVQERCGDGARLRICRGERCEPLACAGEAAVPPEASLDTLLPLVDGRQRGVLVVFRLGEGGHLVLRPVISAEGGPVCVGGAKVEEAMAEADREARRSLRPGEHLGARGGKVETRGDRVRLTTGIYRPKDPNCCPTGGMLQTELALSGGRLELRGVERLPPATDAPATKAPQPTETTK